MKALPLLKQFPYPYFQYGSADSTDRDVIIAIPREKMPDEQEERKRLVKDLTVTYNVSWNATLAVFESGIMVDTIYPKAWVDGLNNAFLATYHLHEQHFPIPVVYRVERNYTLAIYKAVRTVLTYLARTDLRPQIKPILKGIHPFELKLEALEKIDLSAFTSFNQPNVSDTDVWKLLAFYIGQNLLLIEKDIEVYTKIDLCDQYAFLKPFIQRQPIDRVDKLMLEDLKVKWVEAIRNFGQFKCNGQFLLCQDECVDMKNEVFL